MPTIDVTLPGNRYRITVEPGALARLGPIVRDVAPHGRAMLVVDERVRVDHAPAARSSLDAAGFDVTEVALEARESRKTLAAVETLYERFASARAERGTPVVALGGGLVGDVAGFAAATWLRGVPVIQVPTTLLAMVDASIGGKTGVNFALPDSGAGRTLGKNLVGAFWQPRAVVADPAVLATLDERDFRCGLAESLKHAIIADAALLEALLDATVTLDRRDPDGLADLVARSAAIKVGIVETDEREAGGRALLNLGHTFAHAIEPRPELDLRHGEAVAIGVCAAARCSVRTQRMSADDEATIVDAVRRLGLPDRLRAPVPAPALVAAMGFDKKVRGDRLRLVLPTGIGGAVLVDDVPAEVVHEAWCAVGSGA